MGKLKTKIKNMSLRMSFVVYVAVFVVIALILIGGTMMLLYNIRESVYDNYPERPVLFVGEGIMESFDGERPNIQIINGSQEAAQLSEDDKNFYDACTLLMQVSIPVWAFACVICAAVLFYRNKLKVPIQILGWASEKISENELDFTINYDCGDEMGKLCGAYEKMRESLDENNREMWRAMEERKRLNAAFAHDLRTPLTVLRGYTDFLSKYLPQDKISKEKMITTVGTMDSHIRRLENYVQSMNSIQKLEEIQPQVKEVRFTKLCKGFEESAVILCKGKVLEFKREGLQSSLDVDMELAFQVLENLVSNGARYAREKVFVTCGVQNRRLRICVADDGPGFSREALQKAHEPFFRGEEEKSEVHFGLGLYICRVIAEKHGGNLRIKNREGGGAEIIVNF